jgi:hypothetical protein
MPLGGEEMIDRPCEVCTFQHQGYFCTDKDKAQVPGCPFTDHIRDATKKEEEEMMNKETKDQIASVMLQHGTDEQKKESLLYCSVIDIPGGQYGEREMRIAEFEYARNQAIDKFFEARLSLDRTREKERIFEAGYRMAWEFLMPKMEA